MKRGLVYVAGMPIARADLNRAAEWMCEDAASDTPRVYVLVNAHSSKLVRDDRRYADLLNDTDLCVALPDGASVTRAAALLGYGDIGRCPGPDLLEVCCESCMREDIPVFLLGGHAGVAERLAANLTVRYPGLRVAGVATPPFGEWAETANRSLIQTVKDSGARLLWLGVSAPKQEVWAYEHAEELNLPIGCVGAAFDFNSGLKQRAPHFVRTVGLEWLFRLASEPRRLWKRYLVGNTLFVCAVLRYRKRAAGRGT
ncbi:MAG: glycosyltransferase [Actinobacteria bacterium]|nr:glycosyltransferase [Actinomycetota bacterium]